MTNPKNRNLKRLLAGLVPLCALALQPAHAGGPADAGWYVGLNMPLMFVDDTTVRTGGTIVAPPAPVSYSALSETTHKTGFKLAGLAGYGFAGGLRLEGELFLARAEVDSLAYSGITAGGAAIPTGRIEAPISGSFEQSGVLANAWYDLDTGSAWAPFFGGGLGVMRLDQGDLEYDRQALAQEVSDIRAAAAGQTPQPLPPGLVPALSTSDTVFVWHLGAGVGYRLTERTTLQIGYRYQSGGDLQFEGRNQFGTYHSRAEMRIHFLELGLRHRL